MKPRARFSSATNSTKTLRWRAAILIWAPTVRTVQPPRPQPRLSGSVPKFRVETLTQSVYCRLGRVLPGLARVGVAYISSNSDVVFSNPAVGTRYGSPSNNKTCGAGGAGTPVPVYPDDCRSAGVAANVRCGEFKYGEHRHRFLLARHHGEILVRSPFIRALDVIATAGPHCAGRLFFCAGRNIQPNLTHGGRRALTRTWTPARTVVLGRAGGVLSASAYAYSTAVLPLCVPGFAPLIWQVFRSTDGFVTVVTLSASTPVVSCARRMTGHANCSTPVAQVQGEERS